LLCHQALLKLKRCLVKLDVMQVFVLFYLMIAVGLLTLFAAVTDWEWFFKQRRAQNLIKLMGRSGTRVFYGILGSLFIAMGWLVVTERISLGTIF